MKLFSRTFCVGVLFCSCQLAISSDLGTALTAKVITATTTSKQNVVILKYLSQQFAGLSCGLGSGGGEGNLCDNFSDNNIRKNILKEVAPYQITNSQYSSIVVISNKYWNNSTVAIDNLSSVDSGNLSCELENNAKKYAINKKISAGVTFKSACF